MEQDHRADDFAKLLQKLNEEHVRVVAERDDLRRQLGQPVAAAFEANSLPVALSPKLPRRGGRTWGQSLWSAAAESRGLTRQTSEEVPALPVSQSGGGGLVSCMAASVGSDDGPPAVKREESQVRQQITDRALELPVVLRKRTSRRGMSMSMKKEGEASCRDMSSVRPFEINDSSGGEVTLELHSIWHDLYLSNEPACKDIEIAALPFERMEFMSKKRSFGTRTFADPRCSLDPNKPVPLRPHDRSRFAWDVLGTMFLLYDLIAIPFQAAWELDPILPMQYIMFCYWLIDIGMSFNTGFLREGSLFLGRREVSMHYLKRWFLFDVFLLCLDDQLLGKVADTRAVRVLRVARLARLVNVSRVSDNLEEIFLDLGMNWAVIVYAIIQVVLVIFLVGHVLTCTWGFVGLLQRKHDEPSWLNDLDMDLETKAGVGQQYLRSLTWVTGHLLSAPIDRIMVLRTDLDNWFAIVLIWVKLFLMGASLSKISGALGEIGRANAQSKDLRRKLHQITREARLSKDISIRMIRFALHSHQRQRQSTIDPAVLGLLSGSLSNELTVSRRDRFLQQHPLLIWIMDNSPDVYASLCSSFHLQVYADNEAIFKVGTLSEYLYITCHGVFRYLTEAMPESQDSESPEFSTPCPLDVVEFENVRWFCEPSLFAKVLHTTTLSTRTFAESLRLSGNDLAACVRRSPVCIKTIYRYSEHLLSRVSRSPNHDVISSEIIEESLRVATKSNKPDLTQIESYLCEIDQALEASEALHVLLDISKPLSREKIMELVIKAFPEVRPSSGIYDKLKLHDERERTVCSLMSTLMLLRNEYDMFTSGQEEMSKLTPELWKKMQAFIQWVDFDEDMMCSVLVYLAIRGLAKDPALIAQLNMESFHGDYVRVLIEGFPQLTPCCLDLTEAQDNLLKQALWIHSHFNVAQFLQGEISAHQISALQDLIHIEGSIALKVFLMQNIGFMCGIRGTENNSSSLFMNMGNATTLITALEVLQHVEGSSPQAVYWNYIGHRAEHIGLPTVEYDDFVIARLACLCRATVANKGSITNTWKMLNCSDKQALTTHFLADGIGESNFVLKFLPAYFANSIKNPSVGLYASLVVLVDVLDALNSHITSTAAVHSRIVNLQDLATFCERVQNRSVFLAVGAYLSFVGSDNDLTIVVATAHMQRVGQKAWNEQPAQEAANLVRRMRRQIEALEEAIVPDSGLMVSTGGNGGYARESSVTAITSGGPAPPSMSPPASPAMPQIRRRVSVRG